jgi:hypothetical protein
VTTTPADRAAGSGLARRVRSPVVVLLVLAPFLGEVLSTSTAPLDLLLPWKLVLLSSLYGCGALLCREVARRRRLGLPGLVLLAAAYGVYEEALIVHSWFDPAYQDRVGVGGYSRVWDTSLLLAAHLTAFHVAVSICSSVLLVERLFPARRAEPWVGRRGLVLAALALGVLVPLTYGQVWRGPVGPELAAAGLVGLLVGGAFRVRGLTRPAAAVRRLVGRRRPRPRLAGWTAFVATGTHFVLVYALPATGVPWPAGVVLALAPIAAGALMIAAVTTVPGSGELPVVTGILGFFVALDAVIGLGGRYDFIVGALLTAIGLWLLNRRRAWRTRQ